MDNFNVGDTIYIRPLKWLEKAYESKPDSFHALWESELAYKKIAGTKQVISKITSEGDTGNFPIKCMIEGKEYAFKSWEIHKAPNVLGDIYATF